MTTAPVAAPYVWQPHGYAVFGRPLIEMTQALDGLFLGWARELGADEYAFPPAIPASALERVDYFQAFPHLATFPVSLDQTPANLQAFAQSDARTEDGLLSLTATEPVRDVLNPAVCYHVYHLLDGWMLDRPLFATARATCFRREDHYEPLRRQRAFQMREIVGLGTRPEVEHFVQGMRSRLEEFFAKAGLAVRFEPATDPFFAPERNPGYVMQKLLPLKTEMVLDGLAIGSLNHHGERFGRAFGIRREERPASSACAAFGLERWLNMVLMRHAADPHGWPAWLKDAARV